MSFPQSSDKSGDVEPLDDLQQCIVKMSKLALGRAIQSGLLTENGKQFDISDDMADLGKMMVESLKITQGWPNALESDNKLNAWARVVHEFMVRANALMEALEERLYDMYSDVEKILATEDPINAA